MDGIWLPIVTPFNGDKIDYRSYKKMIDHYIDEGIDGLIPLGTTGESPALDTSEKLKLIEYTMECVNKRIPVFVGHGGNYTKKVVDGLKTLEELGIQGILSVSPYYNRPSQDGIIKHFEQISGSTDLDILLYNIPYRTGRGMTLNTIETLSHYDNIVGLKDATGDFSFSSQLLTMQLDNFSILSGEDITFFSTMALGGQGGVLASAHINTHKYIDIIHAFKNNDIHRARDIWQEIAPTVPLLFKEPNPGPVKYILGQQGLISSDECRLPMTSISNELKQEIDHSTIPILVH